MPANDMFHEKTIENLTFRAYVGGNPYIEASEGPNTIGDTVLGYCALIAFVDEPDFGDPGWFICKYGPDEPLIRIDGLSPEGIAELSIEFGIPVFPDFSFKFDEFTDSPCFESLVEWADKHPRLAKSLIRSRLDYLPALGEALESALAAPAPKM